MGRGEGGISATSVIPAFVCDYSLLTIPSTSALSDVKPVARLSAALATTTVLLHAVEAIFPEPYCMQIHTTIILCQCPLTNMCIAIIGGRSILIKGGYYSTRGSKWCAFCDFLYFSITISDQIYLILLQHWEGTGRTLGGGGGGGGYDEHHGECKQFRNSVNIHKPCF